MQRVDGCDDGEIQHLGALGTLDALVAGERVGAVDVAADLDPVDGVFAAEAHVTRDAAATAGDAGHAAGEHAFDGAAGGVDLAGGDAAASARRAGFGGLDEFLEEAGFLGAGLGESAEGIAGVGDAAGPVWGDGRSGAGGVAGVVADSCEGGLRSRG